MDLKIMDVTLRESIYIKENKITQKMAQQLVEGLSSANIDYIEIGYISSEEKGKNMCECCPKKYIEALKRKITKGSKTELVVMLYARDYSDDILERILHTGIKFVRLCIRYDNLQEAIPVIKDLSKYGIKVSANLIRISKLSLEEIKEFTKVVEEAGAEYIYLADSNGSMMPDDVKRYYKEIRELSNLKMGFHPHDNINLASINSLEAVNQGIAIIDCSIYGYGKGLANLDLGHFAAIISRMELNKDINLNKIINTSLLAYDNFIKNDVKNLFFFKQQALITGYKNMNLDTIMELEEKADKNNLRFIDVLLEA